MSIILELMKEKIQAEGVMIDMWEARSIDEFFPTIYIRLNDGKEVAVPSIAVSPVGEV